MAKKNFFLDYFPPPDYLRMPAMGVDISDKSIKYASLARKNGFFVLKKFGKVPVSEGVVVEGEIRQADKLIDYLRQIKQEAKVSNVIVGLPEEKSFLSRVKLPIMDKKEIRGALELQLEEHVPLSPGEAVFDYQIINEDAKTKHYEIGMVVFPRGLIESYENVFREAGLTPLAFETEGHAIIRTLIPREDVDQKKTNMIIDFGKTRTTFIISRGGVLQFTSTVKVGGREIEDALIKSLLVDEKKAEQIKKDIGLSRKKEDEKAFKAILPLMSSIKDEALKYVSYWHAHSLESPEAVEHVDVSNVLLCGGDANLIGMPEYFSSELKIPVTMGNPWVNMFSFDDYVPEMEEREALAYVTAIGLALRSSNMNI